MIIEIAKHERMSETGSSLIRLIQNNETPLLDLTVREAVQNSLDAALPGEGHVQVDFSIREFNRRQLSEHFLGVTDRLNEVYADEKYRLLEIRDSNTHGLKGPLHDGDGNKSEFGNLIKLIYQIGMPQQQEGSGGSWGLGKTVYFRLGIGLVIYYSRVCENGFYESRLAACLVEDDSLPNALLKGKGNHRGIAWWGQQAAENSTMPLTDEREIGNILEVLGVAPYTGEETGTTIIIPFLKDDLRPEIADLENPEEQWRVGSKEPWWNVSDADYLKIALQRWYAPRLMNEVYPHGRWLRATVNGEGIHPNDFLSVFKILQDLYNTAVHHSSSEPLEKKGELGKVQCIPINLRSTFENGSTAGWVAFAKLSKADLLMGPPNNQLSPWIQVFGRDIDSMENNPALISFTRKPGMIVGYEYTGKWVEGIPKTSTDEYVIGLFVANSMNLLVEKNPKNQELPYLLEEYIRGCEKADHTSWADWTPIKRNPLIIDRIQKNLARMITKSYSEKPAQQAIKKDVVLGKLLADVLLPPEGFGGFSNIQPTPLQPKPGGGSPTGRAARFVSIAPPVYEQDAVRFDYELYAGKQDQPIGIILKVLTESGDLDANAWESEEGVGVRFPMSLYRFSVNSIGEAKQNEADTFGQIVLDENQAELTFKEISYQIQSSSRFNQACGIQIQNASGKILKGSIWIASNDRNVRAAFFVHMFAGGN
ncbi:hypothetical protein P9761_14455 [Brevibacillus centrosporus]|uniref:hypothetical protein n=1 Tax=Brevibacillus centrosporus TaxID=54910 RepID=UPI002E21EAD6|nr:hypothetical protein [Brevibacillus centrosporus]